MLDRWGLDLFRLVEQPTAFVIWTIAFGTIVRLICSWLLGFGTGEAYYFSTIRQLALSYYDQPPLFLWLGWLTEYITGSDSAFIIRLPFLLMFAATTWLTYRLGGLLFDQQVGALAALLLNLSPVFGLSVGSWFQPDGPLMLFWLAASVCVARITFCSPRRRILLWALTGVWLGLAMLSKYHAILLVVGLLLFVLTRRDTWIWFREPGPYLGALIAFAIFTPVIVWNGHNEWVSFRFQGGRILESEGFRPDWLARSIIGQAAWIGPLIWVPIIYVYGRSILRGPQSAKSWSSVV
jgi:4-amino-4-deoxy-L-arabinose transferase-like glycosyltransferase